MALTIQDLREKRSARAKELYALLEANPGDKWKADHQAAYDAGMSEIEAADSEMKRINDLNAKLADDFEGENIALMADRTAKNKKDPASAIFAKWLRGGDNAVSAVEWAKINATLSTTTGSQGGNVVPTDIVTYITDALKAFGGVRPVASYINSTGGFGDLNFPTSDGTAEVGELIGQNTTANALDPSFGTVTLSPYKFSSKIVAVPYELLQDSNTDVEAFVTKRLVTRLGRIQNTYFTTGSGTSQPKGVVTAAQAGPVGTTGQTVTVIYDNLIDLVHKVDPAYRQQGNSRFMMNDDSLRILRKLKDTAGRPIFLPGYDGLTGPMGDTLLGYPIQINQDVAVMAANAKSILFGDFSYYYIRDDMNVRMFRFEDSAYAKLGQVGFLAWMRSGGTFTDVGNSLFYYANSAT
jgi:HK97 family phage major capsid protein